MASVFTKIINGDWPCFKIYENERIFSFLALDQINMGHTLVIPKKEVNHFFDMDENDYEEVFSFCRTLSKVIKKVTDCKRVGLAAQGFEVQHAHIHLIPLNDPSEFSFSKGVKRSEEEMKKMQELIVAELGRENR